MDTHGPNPPFWVHAALRESPFSPKVPEAGFVLCGQGLTWSEDAEWVSLILGFIIGKPAWWQI